MGLGSGVKETQGDRNAYEEIRADSSGSIFNGRNRHRVWRSDRTCTGAVCEPSFAAATAGLQSVYSQYRPATELQADHPYSTNLTCNANRRSGISGCANNHPCPPTDIRCRNPRRPTPAASHRCEAEAQVLFRCLRLLRLRSHLSVGVSLPVLQLLLWAAGVISAVWLVSLVTPRKRSLYSITSSALASKDCGTATPSALAVLRLTTSSNLVGACTGRSPALSPLRMRST
jgi:hypothetical protein